MHIVASQSPDDHAEWLNASSAAKITGDSARTWRRRAIEEYETAEREGRAALAVLLPGGGKPAWHISPSIDPRLTKYPRKQTRDDRARAGLVTRYPVHVVDLAYRRVHWLHRWRRACNGPRAAGETTAARAAGVVAEARRLEAADFKISVRVMMRWHRAYNQIGSDGCIVGVAGLIDKRGCNGTADLEQTTS
ncbi:MAG: hypothetical protein IIA33_09015, partial [Planctomycetes bacterium]|nr:hypothetical protein [Planctomycetota bacterium]